MSPSLLTWSPHADTLTQAKKSGALGEVESVLRNAYALTPPPLKRLCPSRIVEGELRKAGWKNTRVWAPEGFRTADSFDGWKEFLDEAGLPFGVAVEIQWVWQGIYNDLLKFWRAARGGQATLGIEALRGPDSFAYIVQHVFALYRDIFGDVRVVFCALDAPDLREKFPKQAR